MKRALNLLIAVLIAFVAGAAVLDLLGKQRAEAHGWNIDTSCEGLTVSWFDFGDVPADITVNVDGQSSTFTAINDGSRVFLWSPTEDHAWTVSTDNPDINPNTVSGTQQACQEATTSSTSTTSTSSIPSTTSSVPPSTSVPESTTSTTSTSTSTTSTLSPTTTSSVPSTSSTPPSSSPRPSIDIEVKCDRLVWRIRNAEGQHLLVKVTLRDGTVLVGEDQPVFGDGWGEIVYPLGASYEVTFAGREFRGMQDVVCGGTQPPAAPPRTPSLPVTGLSNDTLVALALLGATALLIGGTMVWRSKR